MGGNCITVRQGDALRGVQREYHTRKRGCYVLFDKHGQYLIITQKLRMLVTFLNSIAPDAASRVSMTALHEIVDTCDNRVGGYSKYRWKLRFAPLEDAGSLLESERGRFERTLILGQPECYMIEPLTRCE